MNLTQCHAVAKREKPSDYNNHYNPLREHYSKPCEYVHQTVLNRLRDKTFVTTSGDKWSNQTVFIQSLCINTFINCYYYYYYYIQLVKSY